MPCGYYSVELHVTSGDARGCPLTGVWGCAPGFLPLAAEGGEYSNEAQQSNKQTTHELVKISSKSTTKHRRKVIK